MRTITEYSSFELLSVHISSKKYHFDDLMLPYTIKYEYDNWVKAGIEVTKYYTLADSSPLIASESGLIIAAQNVGTFIVYTENILEIKLEERGWSEVGISISSGSISGAMGATALGSVVGGVLFGGVGAIAGAVSGHARERDTQTETKIESVVTKHVDVVKIFTTNPDSPYFSLQFRSNHDASEFYGFLNAALHEKKRKPSIDEPNVVRHEYDINIQDIKIVGAYATVATDDGYLLNTNEINRLKIALENGDINAYYYIGYIYLSNQYLSDFEGNDYSKMAEHYFNSGAQNNHPYCAAELAQLRYLGIAEGDPTEMWRIFFKYITYKIYNLKNEFQYACTYIDACLEDQEEILFVEQLRKLKEIYLSLSDLSAVGVISKHDIKISVTTEAPFDNLHRAFGYLLSEI